MTKSQSSFDSVRLLPREFTAPGDFQQREGFFTVCGLVEHVSGPPSAATVGLARQDVRFMFGDYQFQIAFLGGQATRLPPVGQTAIIYSVRVSTYGGVPGNVPAVLLRQSGARSYPGPQERPHLAPSQSASTLGRATRQHRHRPD